MMYLLSSVIRQIPHGPGERPRLSTHEKMTRLGRRFLEKGRRSGSCFEAQSSMVVSSTSRWRGAAAMEGALKTNARGVWCSRCSSR